MDAYLKLYIYIYIYKKREREREREMGSNYTWCNFTSVTPFFGLLIYSIRFKCKNILKIMS